MQTGTLKELDVKAGDVVGYDYTKTRYTVSEINQHLVHPDGIAKHYSGWDTVSYFSIISRADAPNPTAWAEMTDAEKGAILLAAHNGADIEAIDPADEWDTWETVDALAFAERIAYRVRQTPSWLPLVVGGKYATGAADGECIAVIDGKAWLTPGGDNAAYTWDANTGTSISLYGVDCYNITGFAK